MAPDPRHRVLHVVEDRDTSGFFLQLAKFADRGRFQVSFTALKPLDPAFVAAAAGEGASVSSLGCRSRWSYPLAVARLAQHIASAGVDVVHAHLFEPGLVGLGAAWLAKARVRLLTRHYSNYHTRMGKRVHVALDRLATALSHAVVAVSEHTAEHLLHDEHAPVGKVRTIANGVDFGRLALSSAEARQALRRQLAPGDDVVLLVPARLHPEKGHSVLFEALERLRPADLAPRVLLAGEGPFREAYAAEVAARGLAGQVRFLGHRRDIADLMAIADAVVLPSVAEAFGLVLVEALYLGTPVGATRVGGVPEIVSDGVDGLLADPGDAVSLASVIERLCRRPLREQLAGKGRERVRERFAFETTMRAYESLYAELLGQHA